MILNLSWVMQCFSECHMGVIFHLPLSLLVSTHVGHCVQFAQTDCSNTRLLLSYSHDVQPQEIGVCLDARTPKGFNNCTLNYTADACAAYVADNK